MEKENNAEQVQKPKINGIADEAQSVSKAPAPASHFFASLYSRDELFPAALAALIGAVAAIIIIIAGLSAERQIEVVMGRALVGFLVAGGVIFFACRWLNEQGIPLYVHRHEELQNTWVSEPEQNVPDMAKEGTSPDEMAAPAKPADEAEEAANEPTGFSSLEDSVQRVKVPEKEAP